jgi:hypothetical protein
MKKTPTAVHSAFGIDDKLWTLNCNVNQSHGVTKESTSVTIVFGIETVIIEARNILLH